MKVGVLVRHNAKPEWGTGVVVEVVSSKVKINFENHAQVLLDITSGAKFLSGVAEHEVATDSALRDPSRWDTLSPAPEHRVRARPGRGGGSSPTCAHCGKPLNRAQYSLDRKKKSCPRCSTEDGKQHVFYDTPDAFGTTDARASDESPEGVQSYCATCRGRSTDARSTHCDAVVR